MIELNKAFEQRKHIRASRAHTRTIPRRRRKTKNRYQVKFNIYKDSAWVPTFAGTHASGRAGQHFELFDSVLGRVKKVTTQNNDLQVQYVR